MALFGWDTRVSTAQSNISKAEKCLFKYLSAFKYSTIDFLGMTTLRRSNALSIKRNSKTLRRMSPSVLVDRAKHVLSYGGSNQCNSDETGASACGLAALNFARIVFSMEQGGLRDTALLRAVMARKCAKVRRLQHGLSELILVSKGSYCHMRAVDREDSSRSRRYLPHSLVREDPNAKNNHIRSSWSHRVQIFTHVRTWHRS